MRIGITGVRGLVGREVAVAAAEGGHKVVGFSRTPRPGGRLFQPGTACDTSGLDAIVHLAGEPVLGLWTRAKRRRILESRVEGTRSVVDGIRAAGGPPVFVCASAVGYYGFPSEPADESSPPGAGFLAEVCGAWEAAAGEAEALGARVVRVRIGLVLGRGGALALAAPVFKLGLGGRIGSGRQWMSAIHVRDAARMILWAIESPQVSGPLNAVMPEPFTNAEFTRELAAALGRPAFLPAPAAALRLALGGLSDLFLESSRVVPRRPLELGFTFTFPTLREALRSLFEEGKTCGGE